MVKKFNNIKSLPHRRGGASLPEEKADGKKLSSPLCGRGRLVVKKSYYPRVWRVS